MDRQRKIYYSRTSMYKEILMDWMLLIVAVVMIFSCVIAANWFLSSAYQVQITIDSTAMWIEHNFKKTVFIILLLMFITLHSWAKMRERRALTYRYYTSNSRPSPYRSYDSFKTDSDWDEYERTETYKYRNSRSSTFQLLRTVTDFLWITSSPEQKQIEKTLAKRSKYDQDL